MKRYPITVTENLFSPVIGILSLDDDYVEKFDKGLTTLNIAYIEKDGKKELANVSLALNIGKKK